MRTKTIQAMTCEEFDEKSNAMKLELETLGTPVKFEQTHMAVDSAGVITGYSVVMYYKEA